MQNHVQRGKNLLKLSLIFSFFWSLLKDPASFSARFHLLSIRRKGWKKIQLNQRPDKDYLFHWLVTVALQIAVLQAPLPSYKENRKNVKYYRWRILSFLGKGSSRTSTVSIPEIIQPWQQKTKLTPSHKIQNIHCTLHSDVRKHHPLEGEIGFRHFPSPKAQFHLTTTA